MSDGGFEEGRVVLVLIVLPAPMGRSENLCVIFTGPLGCKVNVTDTSLVLMLRW